MCERREKGAATFVSFARFVDIEFQNFTPVQKTCIVAETLAIPAYIATKAFLSFIGLGVQPPIPSWGNMIADGYGALRSAPHIIFLPRAGAIAGNAGLQRPGRRYPRRHGPEVAQPLRGRSSGRGQKT